MRRPMLGCLVALAALLGGVGAAAAQAAAPAQAAAAVQAAAAAQAAAPKLSWQFVQTRCVGGTVHLDVAITGAVVGQSYAIYGTSGLRATNEEVVAKAASFTASFTPSDAYGSNDAAHFSVTGDVEAPVIGQQSQTRTISAACAASSRSPNVVIPSTLSTALGFDVNALAGPHKPAKSHRTRDLVIGAVAAAVVLGGAVLLWTHPWRRRRWWADQS